MKIASIRIETENADLVIFDATDDEDSPKLISIYDRDNFEALYVLKNNRLILVSEAE